MKSGFFVGKCLVVIAITHSNAYLRESRLLSAPPRAGLPDASVGFGSLADNGLTRISPLRAIKRAWLGRVRERHPGATRFGRVT
jgi:hypothetical protein